MAKFLRTSTFALFFAIMIFQGCSDNEVSNTSKTKPQSLSTTEKVKVKFTESGNLQAILYSDSLVDREKNTWGWNIDVDFFTGDDTISDGGMLADSGFVLDGRGTKRRQVLVFGNVHLTAPDGTELFADSLRWNPKTQQIESGSKVKVVKGKEIIHGIGFKSDPNFKHIKIINVSGRIEE
ncbi:LPS export ABC transporter periplasmic protein LptC [bacterium]|nr:LPS export ABC transporter periplasmic protein LptC [bacterium]